MLSLQFDESLSIKTQQYWKNCHEENKVHNAKTSDNSSMVFNYFFPFFSVPPGRVCPRGQVFSDCVSSCPPSCSSPQPPGPAAAMGQCREECVGGCECPPGVYLHQGRCLKRDDCPCFHRRRTYQSGDTIQQRCNTWYDKTSCVFAFSLKFLHKPFPFFFFLTLLSTYSLLILPVCAKQASGSVLGRSAPPSAAWWGHYRWPPLTKRGIHYREETVPSLLWRWET